MQKLMEVPVIVSHWLAAFVLNFIDSPLISLIHSLCVPYTETGIGQLGKMPMWWADGKKKEKQIRLKWNV